MKCTLFSLLLLFTSLTHEVRCQRRVSPCPTVFTYDTQSEESDTWYGTVRLQSSVPLYGIRVDIIFDRRVTSFGAYRFEDVSSSDNVEYRIESKNFKLDPGRTLLMNIFVRYRDYVPLLKQIRLNGQNFCVDLPTIAVQPIHPPSAGDSHFDYETTKKTTRRENPNNLYDYNYETTTQRNVYTTVPARKTYTTTATTHSRPIWEQTSTNSRPSNNGQSGPSRNTNSNSNGQGNGNAYGNRDTYYNRPANADNGDRNTNNNNRNPSRDPQLVFVGDTNNNFDLKPYDQRTTTTTARYNYNTRATTTSTKKPSYFQGDLPFLNNESTTHSILSAGNDNQCGTVIPKANPLIVNGLDTHPGSFPWHAAIYFSEIGSLKYICGGSLISMSSIMTAAHCVTHSKSRRAVNSESLLIYMGKHNLQKWTGQEQDGKVAEIVINPDYDAETFYSDISILRMKDSFSRTNYVRPVCLWKFDSDLKIIVDKLGSVPGWGYNENGLVSEDLSYIQMPIVTHETCIWSNRDFFSKITSDRSFCAGFKNGSSTCNGDSGGGLVFKQGNKWYLRGVVSVSIALQNTLRCDPHHYSVFVDVAKFTSWIENNM